MDYLSEIVWLCIGLAALTWELIGVKKEKDWGIEPLTRIVRDRLMKRFWPVKLIVLTFLGWLMLHFFVGGSSPVGW